MNPRQHKLKFVILSCVLGFVSGCSMPSVVLIPPGEPIQLAQDVAAHVYVTLDDGARVPSQNKVVIPHGWWIVPDEDSP